MYNPETRDKKKVYKMINDKRISLYAAADYRPNSEIDILVKNIICKTAANEKIVRASEQYRKEAKQSYTEKLGPEEEKKQNLIIKLIDSKSFMNTHATIKELNVYTKWKEDEKEELFMAAMENQQIKWILQDADITLFYSKLIKSLTKKSKNAEAVEKELEKDKK